MPGRRSTAAGLGRSLSTSVPSGSSMVTWVTGPRKLLRVTRTMPATVGVSSTDSGRTSAVTLAPAGTAGRVWTSSGRIRRA